MSNDTHSVLDQTFRKSYGKINALLLAKYGTSHIELIENSIMEAYYKALKTWPYSGVPESTQGWLYRVAHNALVDELRKIKRRQETSLENAQFTFIDEVDVLEKESIEDPELKLLFLICHPDLAPEVQLAFMLKTLSGFGDREISRALMIKESTIKKRLLRARKAIREKDIQFDWPSKDSLSKRLGMVHRSLYLLFNEGFYSSHPELWLRKDLCLEAMRLCKYLADHELAEMDTYALMSLMCYHISRYESRLDENGNVILLDKQDRSKWNTYFIGIGHHYLEKSANNTTRKTRYQLEAFISAQHCIAKTLAQTDWNLLKSLYQSLYKIDRQDLVLLNLVIVHLHLNEMTEAQELYNSMNAESFASNKMMYYMVGVELYSKLKDQMQIELLLERAIQSSSSEKETGFIKKKLEDFRN